MYSSYRLAVWSRKLVIGQNTSSNIGPTSVQLGDIIFVFFKKTDVTKNTPLVTTHHHKFVLNDSRVFFSYRPFLTHKRSSEKTETREVNLPAPMTSGALLLSSTWTTFVCNILAYVFGCAVLVRKLLLEAFCTSVGRGGRVRAGHSNGPEPTHDM
jgi:hypothetical protein